MIFTETELQGAFIIDPELRPDKRGFFARTFCAKEFEELGLNSSIIQCNMSFTHKRGTIRGMHYQVPPAAEAKLVRCTRGAIYDVFVDLRPQSPTYKLHRSIQLTAENRRAVYIPEMFAHGFQTLTNDTEVTYQMSEFYAPELSRGFRYDDRAFQIKWPLEVTEVSERDLSWPLFDTARNA